MIFVMIIIGTEFLKMMTQKYYFDEAGYTGSDLTNADQPFFCLGSAKYTDDEIKQIKNDLSLDDATELHFKKLYKSTKGQQRIHSLLSHPLIDKEHIKIGIAEKRYCIYAQIVDTLIETMAHSIGENIYANRGNLIMANLLYTFAVNHSNQPLVHTFEKAFVYMIREQDNASIIDFYQKTNNLYNDADTNKEFKEMLKFVIASRVTVNEAFSDDKFYLDNTLTVFVSLVFAWYKQTGIRLDIKFDDSKPIATKEDLIRQLMKKREYSITIGPKEMEHQYPLPIEHLELVDSSKYLGIQIADIIASAANFILTNKNPQYDKFREKLKSIPVLQVADVTLTPASATFLEDAMNTPYNETPIDTLTSFIEENNKVQDS